MPFRYDLCTIQRPKVWTSKITEKTKILQEYYDREDANGYSEKLAEFRKEIPNREKHDFRLTDGKIYEIFDEGETLAVPIQFMVKGSVITWSFTAPKDETHQSWRDLVFNTAALAHQSVELGCETYYRGSNAYHLKKMHMHAGESEFNHNHYRLINDHPITPKEVAEHLRAFFNQANGKLFIPDWKEVELMIHTYKIYWAEYEMDPRYAKYYPLAKPREREDLFKAILSEENQETREKVIDQFLAKLGVDPSLLPVARSQLVTTADEVMKLGKLDSKTVERLYEAFMTLKSEPFPTEVIAPSVTAAYKFQPERVYAEFLVAFGELSAKANLYKDFKEIKGYEPPRDNEVDESTPYIPYEMLELGSSSMSGSSISSQSSGSPSEQYVNAIDQMMTLDDEVEFKLFAQALTNRCRSIDDAMLGELRPNDFRKALRLYNAMKCLTNGVVSEESGKRFDPKVYEQVCKLRDEIRGMVNIEEDPGPAMEHIFKWIQKAPPKLEEWIKWVETNGSRGLGSEIAHAREISGKRARFFGVKMDDRPANVANIADLKATSLAPKDQLLFNVQQYVGSIMHLMGESVYQDKAKVGMRLIEILEGGKPISSLPEVLEQCSRWNGEEEEGKYIKGDLLSLVNQTQDMMKLTIESSASTQKK